MTEDALSNGDVTGSGISTDTIGRPMRVGVVVSEEKETQGGGFTFQQNIVAALGHLDTVHEFIILDKGEGPHELSNSPKRINLASYYQSRLSGRRRFLRAAARKYLPQWVRNGLGSMRRVAGRLTTVFIGARPPPKTSLERAIEDFDVDIVWFLSPACTPVAVPFILTVWDLQHRLQPYFPEVSVTGWTWELRESCYRSMIPRATLTVTGTHVGREEVIRFYAPHADNVRVIPFPVPSYVYEESEVSDEDVLARYGVDAGFLFYPAQFWPHKNHINLIRGLALIQREHGLQLDVVFVGSDQGNAQHVRNKAAELGVRVHFPGFVPAKEIPVFYRQSLALVFPSLFGPDNIPPLEAFALGCPVIAARIPGADEQLGDAALLFDPKSPVSVAQAILKVKQDDTLRQQLVERGHKRARERTVGAYVRSVADFLDEFEAIRKCW